MVRQEYGENKVRKYWIVFFYDDDKNTFNPGLIATHWDVVREIERRTCELQREGRKVHIATTREVYAFDDLISQEECVRSGSRHRTYDPFLIW